MTDYEVTQLTQKILFDTVLNWERDYPNFRPPQIQILPYKGESQFVHKRFIVTGFGIYLTSMEDIEPANEVINKGIEFFKKDEDVLMVVTAISTGSVEEYRKGACVSNTTHQYYQVIDGNWFPLKKTDLNTST